MDLDQLRACKGFDWDDGNSGKDWELHQVSDGECEQGFFNAPIAATININHSDDEDRIAVLGKTDASRKLYVVCTIRGDLVRVISARDMTRPEREVYYTYG